MTVADLTDDDIGRSLWVKATLSQDWRRVTFEGLASRPGDRDAASADVHGGAPYWFIMRCSPMSGLMHFRTPSGTVYTGLLVRSTAEVVLVDVLYAVSADGEIVEVGEIAA